MTKAEDEEAGQVALALYRKYRPRTFAEVIGQEHVTEPLSQALRSGRLHHAYLFSGPRGCGKTSSARILARSLNCEQGPTPEPCGACGSCRSLANDGAGSIDVIEIDAASHGGVDDARELRERAFFAPASSRYKIYVIDEAHMVSTQGFNALLKLVEEPPEYVKFIFATTEPDKVLGTIRSRTHHYPFRLIPPAVLRPYLEQLCEAEGVRVDPGVFPLVVRAGGGSARDSLSVLDQLIAGAGPDGVSYQRAVALLGVTDAALIDEMCDALAAGDGAAAYATVDRVAEAGHDPRRFASDLLERFRDLIILQQVPDAVAKGLIDGPSDAVERMAAQAQRMGPAMLSRCADTVHNGLVEMRGTTGPRLLLELVCARMLLPGADDSSGALLQRMERLERRLALGGGAAFDQEQAVRPAPVPASSHAPAPPQSPSGAPRHLTAPGYASPDAAADASGAASQQVASAPPDGTPRYAPGAEQPSGYPGVPVDAAPGHGAAGEVSPGRRTVPAEAIMPDPVTPDPAPPGAGEGFVVDAPAVRQVWREIVETVKASNKRIAALVNDATVSEVSGETVVLTFRYPVHAQMVSGQVDVLVAAFRERFGGSWDIRCGVAGERGAPGGGAGAGPARSAGPRAAGSTGGSGGGPRGAAGEPGGYDGHASWQGGAVPAQSQQPGPARVPLASAGGGAAGGAPAAQTGPGQAPSGPVAPVASGGHGGPVASGGHGGPVASGGHGGPVASGGHGGPVASGGHGGPDMRAGGHAGAGAGQGDQGGPRMHLGGQAVRAGGPAARSEVRQVQAGQVQARREATDAPGGGDDDGWPEIARPGGGSSVTATMTATATATATISAPARPVTADPGTATTTGAGLAQAAGPGLAQTAGPGFAGASGTGLPAPAGPGSGQASQPSYRVGAGADGTQAPTPAAGATGLAGATGPVRSAAAAAARAAAAGRANGGLAAARAAASAASGGLATRAATGGGPTAGGAGTGGAAAGHVPVRRGAGAGGAASGAWGDGSPLDEPPFDPEYDGFDPGDEPLDDDQGQPFRQSGEEQALQLLRDKLGAEKIGEIDAR